jgi:polyhydroxyalkanoate synthase
MTAMPPPIPPDAASVWFSNDRALEMARAVLGSIDAQVGLTPKELVWRKNKARLYRYVRSEPATHRTPIFLVLPLINRSYILDLRPGASFVGFLLNEGFDVFLIDWGTPADEDQGLDVTALVTRYLPRAARAIQRTTGADQMTVLGYCIGGTLAACFAALHPEVTRNLVLLTAPIDFSDAGQFGRMTARGSFPVEQLTDTYPTVPSQFPDIGTKMLNPVANYVGTYRQLWTKLADPEFDVRGWQAMYRWVNDSVPFAGAAFRQWIVEFYQENRLARNMLDMDGRRVRLADIRCPVLNIAASRDQIAPRTTTSVVTSRVSSNDASEILVEGGHVGIVVGRRASQDLWPHVGAWLAAHD